MVAFGEDVILSPPSQLLSAVRDSKLLTPRRRLEALELIKQYSLYLDTELVSHRVVDRLNVNGATEYALRRLAARMAPVPDTVVLDGRFKFTIGCELITLVKGDSICLSVAAASIAAKVRRDLLMERFDARYPGYGFARHKGYGTEEHRACLESRGPCPIHRRSYEPVRSLVAGG
jgi:ribonuclease HII